MYRAAASALLAAGFGARLTCVERVIRTGSADVRAVFLAGGGAGLSLVRLSVHVFFGFVTLVLRHAFLPRRLSKLCAEFPAQSSPNSVALANHGSGQGRSIGSCLLKGVAEIRD